MWKIVETLQTDDSKTLMAQRWVLGLVMAPHGAQKLLGLFGGYGFDGTMTYLQGVLHIPAPLALLVIMAESAGALGLVLGAGTRLCALGIAANMIGAILMTHARVGFFMNWFGSQSEEGFEYHLLALGLAIPLIVRGGGAWALDGWLASVLTATRPRPVNTLAEAR